jgi:hypothetical protein
MDGDSGWTATADGRPQRMDGDSETDADRGTAGGEAPNLILK